MRAMTSPPTEIETGSLRVVPEARVMTGYRYLVEQKLGRDVCAWVQERRDAGKSWNAVAKEMTVALGYPKDINMSRTLLQKWCPASPPDPASAEDEPAPAEADEE